MLGLGSQGENQGRGHPAFSANPGRGEGGRCVPEAAPRPEPWSLGAGVGVSPAATEPHLSPQEHRVLTNPTLSPSHRVPGAWRGTWDTGRHGKPLWPQPTIQISRCRQTRGRGSSKLRGGSTTWGSAWAQGRPHGRLLGPLASCRPSPQLSPRAPRPPHPGSRGLLGTGPAPSAALLCVRVSLVGTLTRVDPGSQVAIHRGHVGAASAQGEAWSSPPTVRKSQSARARPWIPAARVCPFPAFVPSVRPSRGGERVHSR